MSQPKEPRVTRRDTLRLASAAGALGAGLGITLTARGAGAAYEAYKQKLDVRDVGTMALKIKYVGPDGSEQLLTALDLTASFQKLAADGGASLKIELSSYKEKWSSVFSHSISIHQAKPGGMR